MSLVGHQGGFPLFHLFGIVSSMLQPFLACYGLFRTVPFLTSDNVTERSELHICYKSTSWRIASVIIKWGSLKYGTGDLSKQFRCPLTARKSRSFNWVFKVNLHKILFSKILALKFCSKYIGLLSSSKW